jgi:hypothetical protein
MKSFKLKNKLEEQKNLEEQKKQTEINSQNKNLNFIQKNPQTAGAIFLGITTFVLIFINAGIVWVIPIIFGARCLLKAKKISENKKFITIGYIIVYLPVLYWILGSLLFAINTLYNTK